MEINIEDYLTKEEIADIVRDETRVAIHDMINSKNQFDRIVSNSAYTYVIRMCSEKFNEDMKKALEEKVQEVIQNLTDYCVFHRGSYGLPPTRGSIILDETCEKMRPLLEEKMKSLINDIDIPKLDKWDVSEILAEAIVDRAFGGEAHE